MKTKVEEQAYKAIVMELLERFVDFCQENQLTYYLAYGTCLGAVRHKGMIPWDDDIDVSMPRPDYNRMLEIARKRELPFCVLAQENTPGYPQYFAKVSDRNTVLTSMYMEDIDGLGAFVDVFPMDEIYLTEKHIKKLKRQELSLTKMMALSRMKTMWPTGNIAKAVVKYVLFQYAKMRGYAYWQAKLNDALKTATSHRETKRMCYAIGDSVLDGSLFGTGTMLRFGAREYNCPEKTAEYLTELYGDYMQFPPVEQRVSQHDFEVWYR